MAYENSWILVIACALLGVGACDDGEVSGEVGEVAGTETAGSTASQGPESSADGGDGGGCLPPPMCDEELPCPECCPCSGSECTKTAEGQWAVLRCVGRGDHAIPRPEACLELEVCEGDSDCVKEGDVAYCTAAQ